MWCVKCNSLPPEQRRNMNTNHKHITFAIRAAKKSSLPIRCAIFKPITLPNHVAAAVMLLKMIG
jgi:hypothetical protein